MLILPAYAVILWYLVARHRRTWKGVAFISAGFGLLVFIAYFHWLLSKWTNGRVFLPTLQAVLYPYSVLTGVVGVYICCVPHRREHCQCAQCAYDLSGLEGQRVTCPECGREQAIVASEGRSASQPAKQHAEEKREDGQARDEHPAKREKRAIVQGLHHGQQAGGGALGDHLVLVREPGDARLE